MNVKKLFIALAANNIHDAEYRYSTISNFNFSIFRNELTGYGASTTSTINVDAIINNKFAMVATENTSNSNIDNIIKQLIESAQYTNKDDALIYKEKSRYRHFKYFNQDLMNISQQKKIDIAFQIEKKLKALDNRIKEVEVVYEESAAEVLYQNTANIKLKTKNNSYTFSASVVLKEGKETQNEYLIFTDNDFNKFNVDNFVQELYQKAVKKLNPVAIETKKYKVVFSPQVVDSLLGFYVSQLSAEQILKNTSWFKDKLNTQVANKRVTILETPLKRDQDFSGFDAQGVPCKNYPLIKKGVLLTYLHNLETAKKFNVTSTGNAALANGKIGIRSHSVHLKPGRLTKDELLSKVKDGIYITELEGLHSGMNVESGNFSLKTEGYLIKDGKLDCFIKMITISANLYDIFNRVKIISENVEYIHNNISAPCIYLDNISIAN